MKTFTLEFEHPETGVTVVKRGVPASDIVYDENGEAHINHDGTRVEISAAYEDTKATYVIIRFYHPSVGKQDRPIRTGLTLEQAQEHCSDPSTRKDGEYFDGYTQE